MAKQFWTKTNGDISGPISQQKLKEMAACGDLSPLAEISIDGEKFHPLSAIKGLKFPANNKPKTKIPDPPVKKQIPNPIQIPPLPDADTPIASPSTDSSNPPEPVVQLHSEKPKPFDVFLCYRRDKGSELVRLIAEKLDRSGFRVFLDIDGLSSGSWSDEIQQRIEECNDFIPIITEGFFDRCQDSSDVVRQEIALAIQSGKNVVPLFIAETPFPSNLPSSIAQVASYNGIRYSHEYADESVTKLRGLLTSSQFGLERLNSDEFQPKLIVIITGLILALVIGGTSYYSPSPGGGLFASLLTALVVFPINFVTRLVYVILGMMMPLLGALFGAATLYKVDPNKLYCGLEWVLLWLIYLPSSP